jgi:WD40 repeat protein
VIENFKTGTVLYRFPIPNAKDVIALALVPGEEYLLSCSDDDKTLKLWNLPNGECVEEFHFDQDVLAVACGSNGVVCVGLKRGRVCFLRFNKFASQSGTNYVVINSSTPSPYPQPHIANFNGH